MVLSSLGCMAKSSVIRMLEPDNCPKLGQTSSWQTCSKVVPVMTGERRMAQDAVLYSVKIKVHLSGNYIFDAVECFSESGMLQLVSDEDITYDESSGIITVNLPEGMVDLSVRFSNNYINWEVGYFVNRGEALYLIEDVNVGPNTPMLEVDTQECKPLPITLVMSDGMPIEFGTRHWNGTAMEAPEGSNLDSGGMTWTVVNSKYNCNGSIVHASGVPTYYSNFGLEADTDNPLGYWIPACNKVSDRWAFIFNAQMVNRNFIHDEALMSLNPTSDPMALSAGDYREFEFNFTETSMQAVELERGFGYGSSGIKGMISSCVITNDAVEWNTAVVEKASGLGKLWIIGSTKCGLSVDDSDPDWPMIFGITSPQWQVGPDTRIFQPASTQFTQKPWTADMERWEYYPEYTWGNPHANYYQCELGMKYNASTPFMVTSVWKSTDHDTEETTGFQLINQIKGLGGENREEWDRPECEVYFNGVLVKDKETPMDDFERDWDPNIKGCGTMKYVLTDIPSIDLDGLQPVNTTEVTYDQTLDAWEPPTLTSLKICDSNGMVTNRLDNYKDALCVFFAGGTRWHRFWYMPSFFELWFANDSQSITYDVNAKVEYAPYASGTWQSLPVVENETFRSPALGNYYSVGLGEISAESTTGWYDLRITLINSEGNSQIQTLSPAFKLNNPAGISPIEAENFEFPVRYYDIMGRQVASPSAGQLLIKLQGSSASKVVL